MVQLNKNIGENVEQKQFNRFFAKLIAGGVALHLLLAAMVALQIG